jgi:hypothetical protein
MLNAGYRTLYPRALVRLQYGELNVTASLGTASENHSHLGPVEDGRGRVCGGHFGGGAGVVGARTLQIAKKLKAAKNRKHKILYRPF